MDSGDVESSGAVDYSGGPVEAEKPVEKIAAEDVHFHAEDIANRDESSFFDNPKDQKRREKNEKKRLKAETKRVLKESKQKSTGGASNEVAAHEEELKREQSRIESEHRQAKFVGFLGRRAKHWYIYVGVIAVVAIVICGVIFVPKIIQGINDSNDRKYVSENTTSILKLFKEVVGKELGKDEIEKLASKYKGELTVKYYAQVGMVYPNGTRLESIKMVPMSDNGNYSLFSYENRKGDKRVSITKAQGSYLYSIGDEERTYDRIEDAIDAYVLDTRGEQK